MKRLILLAAILPLALAGCKDDRETEKLKGDLAATRQELTEARDEAKTEQSRLHDRISRLEARVGETDGSSAEGNISHDLAALKAELAKSNSSESQAALEKRVAAVETRVEKAKAEAIDEAKKNSAASGNGAVDEAKIAELAAKRLAEEQAANAPTKKFDEAINRLNISEAEKEAIKQEIVKSKKEILELLEVPTADGRRFGEELVDAVIKAQMGNEGGQANLMNLFADLTNTKLPGDMNGRSYAQALEDIKKRNRETVGRVLTPDDQRKLDRAHSDWTDFEVGEQDPFMALYLQRLKKYQEENKK